MKIVLTALFTFFLISGFNSASRQLTSSQDSLITVLNELRYNYPDSALSIVNQEIEQIRTYEDQFLGELLFLKAAVQYVQSNYLESRNTYQELYTLSKTINDKKGMARALNGRGLIYLGRELYKEALTEFLKALEINKRIENQKNIAVNLLNIGICYQELGEWEEAYKSYHESLSYSLTNDFDIYISMDMNRLGLLFLDKNQLDSAEHYLMKVLHRQPNQWEQSYNLSGLTELEIKRENYTKAIQNGLNSLEIAEQIGAKWDAAEVALKLSRAYEKLNEPNKALEYHKLHKLYSDSLLNEEMNREINWAELQQAKMENEQLKTQKDLLSIQKYRNQLLIALLSSVAFFLLVLALLYRRHIRQKERYNENLGVINKQLAEKKALIEKQNNDLKQINNTKNRLFSILSHDLKSPINSIKQLLEIRDSITEEDVQKYMSRLTTEVSSVNRQINHLLKWANTQMDGFNTRPKTVELSKVVEENLESIHYIAEEKGVVIKHHSAQHSIKIDPQQLNIILSNLLSNSIKYTRKGDVIEITYSEREKTVDLHIEDSGIGMDEHTLANLKGEINQRSFSRKGTEEETGTGLGMLLVKQFLAYNFASMEIESEEGKGTRFILSFPKATEGV